MRAENLQRGQPELCVHPSADHYRYVIWRGFEPGGGMLTLHAGPEEVLDVVAQLSFSVPLTTCVRIWDTKTGRLVKSLERIEEDDDGN